MGPKWGPYGMLLELGLAIDHDVNCVSLRPMHEARDGGQGRRSWSGPPSRAECMGLRDTQ